MNLMTRLGRLLVAATFLAGSPGSAFAATSIAAPLAARLGRTSVPPARIAAGAKAGFLNIPLFFEANHGQVDPSVKFFTRGPDFNLYLTGTEAVMVLPRAKTDASRTPVLLRMKLKGADRHPMMKGGGVLPGRTSYFLGGDRSKWRVGVKQYAKVRYSQVYPGIDMVYYGKDGHVEHDFIVAPGANPGRILVGFEGAKSLKLSPQGDLIVAVDGGAVTYKAPTLYQMTGARRTKVNGRFALAGKNQVRFVVGDYLRTKELVIDPAIMYGTYLGGSVNDAITGIAVDAGRQAYVTGWAVSNPPGGAGGFPAPTQKYLNPPAIIAGVGGKDAFVAKISEDGSTVMWLAWLGGTSDDQATGIALERTASTTPKVFITGTTSSAGAGTSFPVFGPAMQTCDTNTGSLAFVSELAQPSDIPDLVYSTCWGGVSGILTNTATAIAVDSLGAAYVTGTTFATNFPITAGVPAPYNTMGAASQDAFVFKVNPAGTGGVAYSMLLGPSTTVTNANGIAVDANFRAWVVGRTTSDAWPAAPLVNAFAATRTAGVDADAFAAEVAADGKSLLYATYINGSNEDTANAVALSNGGATPYHVFVAGWTVSVTDFPSTAYLLLPTSGPGSRPVPYQQSLQGADDGFIFRLDPAVAGTQGMVYATHVGAAGGADRATSLALDTRNDAYIAGWTRSANWPVAGNDTLVDCSAPCVSRNVTGAVQTNTSTDEAAFVAAISTAGLTRDFFSYLGGSPGTFGQQEAYGIALDARHNIYVAGITPSNTFPATTGSVMDGSAGTELLNGTGTENATDGFVTKIAPVLSFGVPLVACTISGISPVFGAVVGGSTVTITGTLYNGLTGAGAVTFGGSNAALYSVNASSTVITAVTPAHLAGTVTLVVTTGGGTCSISYLYGTAAISSCGDDFFYPSPATGAVGHFAYCMDQAGTARIRVYNAIGDLAAKVEDAKSSGSQVSDLNTARLAPGVYLYLLEKDYGGGNKFHSKVKKFVVKH